MKSKTYTYNATEELQILYSSLLNDIQFYKSQQWSITNYTILIQAALVGISQIFENSHVYLLNIFLIILSVLVMLVGLTLLSQFEKDRKASKDVKDKILRHFSPLFNSYLGKINPKRNKENGNDENKNKEKKNDIGEKSSNNITFVLKVIICISPLVVFFIISLQSIPNPQFFWFLHR
jgi:hypothetical protein